MNRNQFGLFYAILAFALILNQGTSMSYHMPPVKIQEEIVMRVGEIKTMDYPEFRLNQVKGKRVEQLQSSGTTNFESCSVTNPFVRFEISGGYLLKDDEAYKRPLVITRIEDIFYEKNILDLYRTNKRLVAMLTTGQCIIYKYHPDKQQLKQHSIIHLFQSKQEKLLRGEFVGDVSQSDIVYFVAQSGVFKIDISNETSVQLTGYENPPGLVKAIWLNDNNFVAAYIQKGVYLWQIDPKTNKVKVKQNININKFRNNFINRKQLQTALVDLTYDRVRQMLFVLDSVNGIYVLNLRWLQTKDWFVQFQEHFINLPNCQTSFLQQDYLYVACFRELFKVDIRAWPKTTVTSLPTTQIRIKEIVGEKDLIVLVGTNFIEFQYMGKITQFYDGIYVKQLIIKNDTFTAGSELGITYGTYSIDPMQIKCQANQQSQTGTHRLQIITEAECNQEYMNQYAINNIYSTPEDTCIYTTYVDVKIWSATTFPKLTILGVALTLLGVGCLVLICVGRTRLQYSNLRRQLETYQNLASGSKSKQGHIQVVEQKMEQQKTEQKQEKFDIQ